jgi:hypothetical protein
MEATQEETKAAVKRQEPGNIEDEVDTMGTLEDRYVEWHLVVRRRQRLRRRTQGKDGFWKKAGRRSKNYMLCDPCSAQ